MARLSHYIKKNLLVLVSHSHSKPYLIFFKSLEMCQAFSVTAKPVGLLEPSGSFVPTCHPLSSSFPCNT